MRVNQSELSFRMRLLCAGSISLLMLSPAAHAQSLGEMVHSGLGNGLTQEIAQNAASGAMLENAVTVSLTSEALGTVQTVLDSITGPAEVEAATQQIATLVGVNMATAEQLVENALNGNLLGDSLSDALNDIMAETLGAGIDELLGSKSSAELTQIVSGLLGGLTGSTMSPATLLATLNNLGIPLSSLGLTEAHLNALLGLAMPLCPASAAPGGSPVAPELGACTPVWSPEISAFCNASHFAPTIGGNNAKGDRISCATGPDGLPTMQIDEYADHSITLQNISQYGIEAFEGSSIVRTSFELYYPPDFVPTSSGRLPLGIGVGSGGQGGDTAADQEGSTIRVGNNRVGDEMYLGVYSYHLDRSTPAAVQDSQIEAASLNQWGESAHMDTPVPKGEWITVVLEMALGPAGQDTDSSAVYMFDSNGKLLDSAGFSNVTYRTDDSWTINRMTADDKRNNGNMPTRDASYYIKNYQGYTCD